MGRTGTEMASGSAGFSVIWAAFFVQSNGIHYFAVYKGHLLSI